MENVPTVIDERDLQLAREPNLVLEEAHRAAKALNDVITKKKKPVIMNGEQYLEFEDWQTVGKFYGVTVKVVSSGPITLGTVTGFEARAVAIWKGEEVSAAEAMCLNDEKNWANKPLFMLRSMAQTRAAAKALRNVLAWVVVLAGYRPTPAEEIQELDNGKNKPQPKPQDAPGQEISGECISEPQRKRFWAIAKSTKASDEAIKEWLYREYDLQHTKDIPRSLYEEVCQRVKSDLEEKGE